MAGGIWHILKGHTTMELRKIKESLIVSAVLVAFTIFIIIYGIPHEVSAVALWTSTASRVNAQTMPYFASYIILLTSGLDFIKNLIMLLKYRNTKGEKGESAGLTGEFRAMLMFLLCIAYALMFNRIGFIAATAICIPFVLLLYGDKNWKHYLYTYLSSAVIYLIFRFILGINV